MEAALKLGATPAQVIEIILPMLFYAAGPAVSNALRTAKDVFSAQGR